MILSELDLINVARSRLGSAATSTVDTTIVSILLDRETKNWLNTQYRYANITFKVVSVGGNLEWAYQGYGLANTRSVPVLLNLPTLAILYDEWRVSGNNGSLTDFLGTIQGNTGATGWSPVLVQVPIDGKVLVKLQTFIGGEGDLPVALQEKVGKYQKADGTFTSVTAEALDVAAELKAIIQDNTDTVTELVSDAEMAKTLAETAKDDAEQARDIALAAKTAAEAAQAGAAGVVSSVQTSINNLTAVAVTQSNGFAAGVYIKETQLKPATGEAPEDTQNTYDIGTGYGVYKVLTETIVFNKAILPFIATSSAHTMTVKVAVLNALPINGNFATIFEPSVVATKTFTNLLTTGKTNTFKFDSPIRVASGKYLFFLISGGSNTLKLANFNTQNGGSTRTNWFFSTVTPSPFTGTWNAAGGNTYLQPQFTLLIETTDSESLKSSVDSLLTNAVQAQSNGAVYGVYTVEAPLKPATGEAPEDTTNVYGVGTGYGIYKLLSQAVAFNRAILPFVATSTAHTMTVKVAVMDSLPAGGSSFAAIFAPYVVATKSFTNLLTTGKTNSFSFDNTIKVAAGKYLFFLISGGSNTINLSNFNVQNAGSTRTNWFLTLATPDPFSSGTWSKAGGNSFLQPEFTLVLNDGGSTRAELQAQVTALTASIAGKSLNPRITLPATIYLTVGKQFNLYYDAIILDIDRGLQSPGNCSVSIICSVGASNERGFQYTPVSGDVGNKTMTVKVYDFNKAVIATKTVTLRIIAATAPTTVKNILMVGDSTLANGPVTDTVYANINALGSNVPKFWGGRGVAPYNNYGWPGAAAVNFATKGTRNFFTFTVTGITTQPVAGAIYSNNGSQFFAYECYLSSGSGYIRLERTSGTNAPTTSGTLTKVSGTGDSTINYSANYESSANAFWNPNTDLLDITNYRALLGMGSTKFDLVTIRLGINDSFGAIKTETEQNQVITYYKTLINAFLADNSATKFIVELPTTDGNTRGGWAVNYGAAFSKEDYQLNIWRLRELILSNFDNAAFNANVEVCATGCCVDRYYGYARVTTQIADRLVVNESWHNNAVHPDTGGSQQIGDAEYPHILKFIQ